MKSFLRFLIKPTEAEPTNATVLKKFKLSEQEFVL